MTSPISMNRRESLKTMAALAAPFTFRHFTQAAPSETVLHASFGAGGMAAADIKSLLGGKHLKLVAVADVDLSRLKALNDKFPELRVYQDWRELLDKEKDIQSVNVSTPDHMHAPITMSAMQRGLHVYTQKPLTQTIYEARALTKFADEKKIISQMGIQIHSHPVHKSIVANVHEGIIGKIKEVHSWSGKHWGDTAPRPNRVDQIPDTLAWDKWLGVAGERPFLKDYYHPGNWRKRLDFGTGTFGDMGCHILDPVFAALGVTYPNLVKSVGSSPNGESWGLDSEVKYTFPGSKYTTDTVTVTWYDGIRRPPAAVQQAIGQSKITDQGSIYFGTDGVLFTPYIGKPVVIGGAAGKKWTDVGGDDHYLQYVDAVRGVGKTSAPFAYAGPLTEVVLLGCLATRFPNKELKWDAPNLKITNEEAANQFVRKVYRKGWEVAGL